MIVETSSGKVEGSSGIFRGIPYARPPRFRPPVPPAPWSGVRPADAYGPAAPQPADEALQAMFGSTAFPADEDGCLTANVWTPGPDGARPVLVWLHGGAFRNGANRDPVFDGRRLSIRHDVVVVTVNYRLGPLGFLHLGKDGGNFGLLDQIAALRWVHSNIAGFGGDPGNVTLFGQSAGAMSVAALLAVPAARGLFHKGIMQSGSAEFVLEVDRAAEVTREFTEALGPVDPADAPVEALLRAQDAVGAAMRARGEGLGLPFLPVVDGDLLPRPPLDAVRAGEAAGVPMILGCNQDEGRLFTLLAPAPDPVALAGLITEKMFAGPTARLAEALAGRGTPVWRYLFGWPSTARGGELGAAHSMELAFVFDNLQTPGVELFTGPEPPQALADEMGAAWTAFARDGGPPAPWRPYSDPDRPIKEFPGG